MGSSSGNGNIQGKLDEILAKLQVKHKSGNEYTCICPAHDDRQASLCVTADDTKILMHCQAGCNIKDVLAAIGIGWAGMFSDEAKQGDKDRPNKPDSLEARTEAVYPYVDADGRLIFEVVRLRNPKSFRQRRPDPVNPSARVWNMNNTTRIPFNLPNVTKAIAAGAAVFIVEGEKDCLALAKIKCVATTNPGGAGKWFDSYSQYLAGADIIIIPDNDQAGYDHALAVACSVHSAAASVKILALPDLPPKGDVSDYLAANSPESFLALAAEAKPWHPGFQITVPNPNPITAPNIDPTLPTIIITDRQQRDITTDAIRALEANNRANSLFIRLGRLVRLRTQISSKIRTAYIDEANPDIVRHLMSITANYVRLSNKGNPINTPPPIDIARDIIARGQYEFPQLDAITESPVMRPDGTILTEPGYDDATHLFYAPTSDLSLPEIPDNPSSHDLQSAKDILTDILYDFPFITEADRANYIAMLLTQILRPSIPGQVPIAIIDAPQPGAGKGLLARLVHLIATGHEPATLTAPTQPEEWTKQITAVLAHGATMLIFDNLEAILDSPDLASLVTTSEWQARILGQSKVLSIPNRATVFVTGNNVRTGGDIARRCYWSSINPNTSTPELRSDFKHNDLPGYVKAHRGEILAALFTLARGWYAAGQPAPISPIVGSFSEWSRIIGGILQHAEIPAFLANADQHRAESDSFSEEIERFLRGIAEWTGQAPFTVKELNNALSSTENADLEDSVPDYLLVARDKSQPGFVRSAGRLFARIAGRRFGEDNIAIFRTSARTAHRSQWFIRRDNNENGSQEGDIKAIWIE